jgi:DNA-binding transcriptional ArsR family regulator
MLTDMATPGTVLDALGDPTRRAVFERVLRGPAPVGVLAAGLPVSRPAVSQHLRVLKDAGLVVDRAAGRLRRYEVVPDALASLRDYFDAFWGEALASFKDVAERAAPGAIEITEKPTSPGRPTSPSREGAR